MNAKTLIACGVEWKGRKVWVSEPVMQNVWFSFSERWYTTKLNVWLSINLFKTHKFSTPISEKQRRRYGSREIDSKTHTSTHVRWLWANLNSDKGKGEAHWQTWTKIGANQSEELCAAMTTSRLDSIYLNGIPSSKFSFLQKSIA